MRAYATILLPLLLVACGKAPAEGNKTATADQPAWSGPGAGEPQPAGKLDRSHAGTVAPATSFEDPQGRATSLSNFRGRPLLVNLWATWCGPCVKEMPTLDALAGREDKRVQVIAISQDGEARDKVQRFFADHHFTALEPYLDPKLDLMSELRVDTLPTTILYDSEGKEVWRMTGMADWQSPASAALIGEALNPAAAR
jgi:thiol-disulfide isomerase/thioredoxin